MANLPFKIAHVNAPPVKCQGIKTKLVPFIFDSITWEDDGTNRWIEPFVGSGVVVLNLAPKKALLSDTNRHIITLYQAIQAEELSGETVREFLETEGRKLRLGGQEYYYEVRQRFNSEGSPYDFLFLNRSCFNGVMRFNGGGKFNVPFCHKPARFSQSYVTKIVNQVKWVATQMRGKEWEFRVGKWDELLADAQEGDFVYLDPPYIGRHVDYYNTWGEAEAARLAQVAKALPCGFALSMWLANKYRENTHIREHWGGLEVRTFRHFYHVGSHESLRNEMEEALIVKPGFAVPGVSRYPTKPRPCQQTLALADSNVAAAMRRSYGGS